MKAATVIMFLTMTVAKHHHKSFRKSIEAKDFFGKINEDIHGLVEKIFDCINLNDNFTNSSNVKRLLTMHYDLSNIAEKSIDALHEVQNASLANNTNRTDDRIRLDNTVEEILKEINIGVPEQIKGKRKQTHEKHKIKDRNKTDASEHRESEELMNFVIEFLDEVSNASMQNLNKTSKRRKRTFPLRRNLKVWEPPPNIKVHVNAMTRRVFNGMKTTVKKFPFIVSVHILGEFACAGSIISRDIIITAATCLQDASSNKSSLNPKSIYVRMGSEYIDRDGETVPIQEMHFHPDFDPNILENNLVLVRLEKRIRFSKQQNRIRRIIYDISNQELDPHGEGVLILGWGATKEDQVVSRDQRLSLDVLELFNFDSCKNLYTDNYVNKENFCAGMAEKRGGACNGDVGGPGVVGPTLMGIISFGAPVCGSSDAPTVFIKLGYYKDWIESVLKPKPERRKSMIWQDHFARRNLYNFDRRIYSNKLPKKPIQVRDDYPEEVSVLKEILSELVKSNTDMVDELLYGDLYADFNDIFISKEQLDGLKRVHGNENFSPSPEVHRNSNNVTVKLSTSPVSPMTKKNDLSSVLMSSPAAPAAVSTGTTRTEPGKGVLRTPDSETSSEEYTDNYESTSSEQGLSIEVITTVTSTTNNVRTTKKLHTTKKTTTQKVTKNKKKIKTTTTAVTTKNTHKRKKKHHRVTSSPMVTYLTETHKKKHRKKHASDFRETAHHNKKRSHKIDETKAGALKSPLENGKEIKASNEQYINNDNVEGKKQFIEDGNDANSKENSKDEGYFKDYYNLADNYKNKIADNYKNEKADNSNIGALREHKHIEEEKKDKYKDFYYYDDNNKIADEIKNKIKVDVNYNDNYKYDDIITGNNKDKFANDENIKLPVNKKKNANNNQAYEEDDNEAEREVKLALRNINQQVDSVEKVGASNGEQHRSDEQSFTPFTPFIGTHMDMEYVTIGLKVAGEHVKRKKKKKTKHSDIDDKTPFFHAQRKNEDPESSNLWDAFLNMKIF